MGINGLVWAQPVADLLSTGFVLILYLVTARKMQENWEAQHPDRGSSGMTKS